MKWEKIPASNKVYISQSKIPQAGRGVFAKAKIKKGEIIETCPMVEIPAYDKSMLKGGLLATYLFFFGRRKGRLALALGYGSIYNHSPSPNAKFKIKPKQMLIEFIAVKNIKKGEEITFNYYGSARKEKNPLWFEG